jgi:hypothetical protein
MSMAAFQDAAREYADAGIVPLPVAADGKRPLVKNPDKFRRPSALRITPKFPDANLGFWCGHQNGLTVVDIDTPKDAELDYVLDTFGPSPIIVRTASAKHHVYYRHDGERRRIKPIKGHEIDILGEGGLCVAPPSVRPSGGKYEFLRGSLADLAKLPKIRSGALPVNLRVSPPANPQAPISTTIEQGKRDDTLFRMAVALAHDAKSPADLLEQLREANAALCKPPLSDVEVQGRVRSAWKYKMNGTLMVPGTGSSILLPSSSIARFLDEGNIDGIALMALFRRIHGGQPGKEFAASPAAMERDRCIGAWDKRRYRNGIRKLCELGELVQITKGGKGKRDPALYRLPTKGGQFAPQY